MKEKLLHGQANKPYLQRADWKLKEKGVKAEQKTTAKAVLPTVRSRVAAECDM